MCVEQSDRFVVLCQEVKGCGPSDSALEMDARLRSVDIQMDNVVPLESVLQWRIVL